MHSSCPRDSLVVFGDEILETGMSWRCRYFETRPYKKLLNEYFEKGAKWTLAPKPIMTDDLYSKVSFEICLAPIQYIFSSGYFKL